MIPDDSSSESEHGEPKGFGDCDDMSDVEEEKVADTQGGVDAMVPPTVASSHPAADDRRQFDGEESEAESSSSSIDGWHCRPWSAS